MDSNWFKELFINEAKCALSASSASSCAPVEIPTKLSEFENDIFGGKTYIDHTFTASDMIVADGQCMFTSPAAYERWPTEPSELRMIIKITNLPDLEAVASTIESEESEELGMVGRMYSFDFNGFIVMVINISEGENGVCPGITVITPSISTIESIRIVYEDVKKIPIEYCDTSEIEAELDDLIGEVAAE